MVADRINVSGTGTVPARVGAQATTDQAVQAAKDDATWQVHWGGGRKASSFALRRCAGCGRRVRLAVRVPRDVGRDRFRQLAADEATKITLLRSEPTQVQP